LGRHRAERHRDFILHLGYILTLARVVNFQENCLRSQRNKRFLLKRFKRVKGGLRKFGEERVQKLPVSHLRQRLLRTRREILYMLRTWSIFFIGKPWMTRRLTFSEIKRRMGPNFLVPTTFQGWKFSNLRKGDLGIS